MTDYLRSKINELLGNKEIQNIMSIDDFYFQKAKNTLEEFLQLEVSESTKEFLLANRKDYNKLKQLFEDSSEFSNFGRLIFSIIAYCDSNAYKKNEFNLYDNKRVLALAYVRMNYWIEQLITYKLEGPIIDGSIKNAIEYLLEPNNNFTMLSENHRAQICQNLFKKQYNKASFKENFSNFFSNFSINVKNSDNYTYLLTRLCYHIEKEWKDNIIGLVCPDTTGWQEELIGEDYKGKYFALWNHRKPNGIGNTLKLLRQCIQENGHFKIFYTSKYKVNYVAEIIDFVENQNELNNAKWYENFESIEWYNDDFSNYKDGSKSASWIYLANKIYKAQPEDYLNFKYYKSYSYPSVGSQSPVVSYQNGKEVKNKILMQNIINLLKYKKQIILQGPPGTGKTREAKLIVKEMLGLSDVEELKDNEQFKIIQFHPSYTYEDFVRGIVAESKGDKIEYKNVNKTLGLFAQEALRNYKASTDTSTESNIDFWIESNFENFKFEIEKNVEENEIVLSDDITLFKVENDNFRYGKNWNNPSRINFIDFKNLIKAIIENKFQFSNQQIPREFSAHAHYRYTYYNALLKIFFEKYNYKGEAYSEPSKDYVLIIDEINRANLSSVLGELIYALEYRGEAVESMYAIDEDYKLILPPNLYIIGTMNTADRSVGHIDYAIRRRFAFVDILPKDFSEEEGITFDSALFNAVKALFTKDEYKTNSEYLSSEFEPKDVTLGHSYFIDKSEEGGSMSIRLEYEIKPILLEYVKDGVLVGENIKQKIEELKASI